MRCGWDLYLKSAKKESDKPLKLSLEYIDGTKEQVQIIFYKVDAERYYALEIVNNGSHQRLFEMQQIKNKPYYMRLTFFGEMTDEAIKNRAKYSREQLNAFRNFISLTDANAEMPILIKRSAQTPDGGIVAVPTFTNYSDLISEMDEADMSQNLLDSDSEGESMKPKQLEVIHEEVVNEVSMAMAMGPQDVEENKV